MKENQNTNKNPQQHGSPNPPPSIQTLKPKPKFKFKSAIIIAAILVFVILIGISLVTYFKIAPSSTSDATANWKEYSAEREGINYSFKYPPEFKLLPNFKTDQNISEDIVSNKASIYENSKEGDLSINIRVGTYYADENYSASTLGNIPSKRYETHGGPVHGCCEETLIYYRSEFLNGKDTLEVSCFFAPVGDKNLKDICEKIASTFNVKVDKTLKWETYTNDKYKYTLRQPEVLTNAYENATGVPPEDNGYKTTSKVFVENAPGDHLLTLTVFPNTQPTELENKTITEFSIKNTDISKLQVSGVDAITFKKDRIKYIELVKDGHQFEFSISNEAIGNDILSTFKFTQ